ncbi:hypothetical protein ILUMI_01269 [Ignelater luminosus]|uniref:PiggyBac transposable element-derived protein domain-containing protein n=1 Tax=Ignelater luminosus TaxID=2038154 RepID=A0A8K0DEY7_IGNLU|nr:hypothetical protein ILUMI_01269 [Ignelater luminosus]
MQQCMFTKNKDLLVALPEEQRPIDYFLFLLTNDFVDTIVRETNTYAIQVLSKNRYEKSRITRWKPLSNDEFLTFLALLFHTGTIKCDKIQDYWKTDYLFNIRFFSQNMSRDRFMIILRCLCFDSFELNKDDKSKNQLRDIQSVIDYFNNKMAEVYCPGKELVLDRPMMFLKGRSELSQYMRNEQDKCDVKLYMLTESSGIILNFQVFKGSISKSAKEEHLRAIVLQLLKDKLDCGHSVYMNSYYTSCNLARTLLQRSSHCIGKLCRNQKRNPKDVDQRLLMGKIKLQYCNGLMIGKWKDKDDVLYISTEYTNEMISYKNTRGQKRERPRFIYEYNKCMSEIDQEDQMNIYYPHFGKRFHWSKKVAIHVFQLIMLNAYYLYNQYSGEKMDLYDFRLEVIHEMSSRQSESEKNCPSSSNANSKELHFLTKIPVISQKGQTKRKRCRVCSSNKKRKATIFECLQCADKPGLCVGECFRVYHLDK